MRNQPFHMMKVIFQADNDHEQNTRIQISTFREGAYLLNL
jgi:hypothetical protein